MSVHHIMPSADCEDYSVRILIGNDYDYYYGRVSKGDTYYINDEIAIGRIELCLNGEWGIICQDYWQNEDASVACSQLGFARAGKN